MLSKPVFRHLAIALAVAALALPGLAQDSGHDKDDKLDVSSSVGDLHLGKDANAQKVGLPLYPGARLQQKGDNDPLNFGIMTEAFGFKIVVAKYESDDAPGKVLDFYRDKLKRYGKVLECHTKEHGGDVSMNDDDDKNSERAKPVKCDGDNAGPVTELKVGTEDHQRVVAVEPASSKGGTTFALIYLHARGKQGDI